MTPVFGFFYWCLRKDKSPYTNQRGPKRQRSQLFGLLIRTSKKKKKRKSTGWNVTEVEQAFPSAECREETEFLVGELMTRHWVRELELTSIRGTKTSRSSSKSGSYVDINSTWLGESRSVTLISVFQLVNTFYVQCGVCGRTAYINSDDPIYSCICLLNDYRKVGSCHSDEQSSSISCAKRTRLPIMSLLNLKCCGAQSVWTEPNSKMCRSCHSVWIPQS